MRGKADDLGEEIAADRITPAYAGKSSHFVRRIISPWDHPRLCGEKVADHRGQVSGKRITPAYAGKSIQLLSYGLKGWDHPRLCGEKISQKKRS